jgi:hypothetical protein
VIVDLLRECGETIQVTAQTWGATWAGLEAELQDRVRQWRADNPAGVIYGIELAGPNEFGAINIDHHLYSDDNRSNVLSSLEQVAAITGRMLTRNQQLVALNDRGYIPAMEAAQATPEEIEEIREADRRAQGLTPSDREHAERDLAAAERDSERWLIRCPNGANAYHTDLSYGRAKEILAIAPRRWSYTGARKRELIAFGLSEQHWSGGDPESGYFAVENPAEETQRKILNWFWERSENPRAMRTEVA